MARGLRRGPNLLRFRSLVDSIAEYVTGILDARQPSKVRYALRDCYLSALAMFFVQDPSLLQFQRRFQQQVQTNNLSATFGVDQLPSDSQFRDLLDRHDYAPILPCFAEWIARLQRAKWLQHYQLGLPRFGRQLIAEDSVLAEECSTRGRRAGQGLSYRRR